MPLLTARNLTKSFGASALLADTELHLKRGEKIGLVGLNGSGKSTLLKLLAGAEPLDKGTVTFRSDSHVAYLAQVPDLRGAVNLLDVALQGAARCRTPLEPYERQLAAEQALQQLGIREPHMPVQLASGGTQRRAALAAALLQQPDLLLLDEPTNHLDADTAAWLQAQLLDFAGAVVLVTHDRYFLQALVSRIVELRRGKLVSYDGTLQDYLETRLDEVELGDRLEQSRRNLARNELDWLRKSPAARSTKQKARIDRAVSLQHSDHEVKQVVQLPYLQAERLGRTILETRALQVGFVGKTVITHLDLTLGRGERLGIVGPNGAGKTTLLRTLQGELPPLSGVLTQGKNTKILVIDQHRTGLDDSQTLLQAGAIAGGDVVTIGTQQMHVASYLGQFLFKTQDFGQQVGTLSGGQKFRLLLARRLQEPMNVLLLDEPTNDLDFDTLEVLEEALLQYAGCVLTVSHDRAFLDRVCTGILHVTGDGACEVHAGNYTAFLARQAAQRQTERQRVLAARSGPTLATPGNAPPKLSFAEDKQLAGIEATIAGAEAEVVAAEAHLQEPAVAADHLQLRAAMARHAGATAAVESAYATWQRLESKQADWVAFKQRA